MKLLVLGSLAVLLVRSSSAFPTAKADWISHTEKENLKRQLKIDEGVVNRIYKDSLGFPTFGIGHLIKATDPEHNKPLGTFIDYTRIYAVFDADLNHAIWLTETIYPNITRWPGEVKEIMVNMVFNLGENIRKFVKLGQALNARDWKKAADEMVNSKWYGQVGKRAERLVARMRNVRYINISTKSDWISHTEKENLKRQLKIDEGVVNRIYRDSLGFPTFGIGHLIKATDPEHNKPLGTFIHYTRIYAVFDADINHAIWLTETIYPNITRWPGEVKEIMVNMVFNLGENIRKFVKLGQALNARDWKKAADEMVNSKWYGQVGKRAERLVDRNEERLEQATCG